MKQKAQAHAERQPEALARPKINQKTLKRLRRGLSAYNDLDRSIERELLPIRNVISSTNFVADSIIGRFSIAKQINDQINKALMELNQAITKMKESILSTVLNLYGIEASSNTYSSQLKPNDVVIAYNGSILVPESDSKKLNDFIKRAKVFSYYYLNGRDPENTEELVRAFNMFVFNAIKFNGDWYKHRFSDIIPLEESIENKSGVCKEKAALLDAMLRHEGVKSKYCGVDPRHNSRKWHVYLTVEINGREYIADPTFGIFGYSEEAIKTYYMQHYGPGVITVLRVKRN